MRCFIALSLPEEVKAELEIAQAAMRELMPEARWTKREGHHITLAFLGDLNQAGLDCAFHAADSLSGFGAIPLRFASLFGFPPHPPHRVLAISLAETGPEDLSGPAAAQGASRLRQAYERLNSALRSAELRHGLPPLNEEYPSGRPFHPHVTLARASVNSIEKRLMREFASCRHEGLEAAFRITTCSVYESRTSSEGAEYRPLREVCLEKKGEDADAGR
jgi:RNA 2',3'-cyclic 3'-phosphodiesterase